MKKKISTPEPYRGDGRIWVKETVASEVLSVSLGTLRNWRSRGDGGPVYHVIGKKSVRYTLADLYAFADAHRIVPRE
jgi:hypothetical protein